MRLAFKNVTHFLYCLIKILTARVIWGQVQVYLAEDIILACFLYVYFCNDTRLQINSVKLRYSPFFLNLNIIYDQFKFSCLQKCVCFFNKMLMLFVVIFRKSLWKSIDKKFSFKYLGMWCIYELIHSGT